MRLIKLKDVMHFTGLAQSTVYKYIADGSFPTPVSLGKRNVAWVESEIQDWIIERVMARDAVMARAQKITREKQEAHNCASDHNK